MRTVFGILVVLTLIAVGAVFYVKHLSAEQPSSFRTANVTRGEMKPTIAATGTIEPEEVVDVGSQVVGVVKKLYVDYGSTVEAGMVMAQIDQTKYQAIVAQAEAALLRAQADLGQMNANLIKAAADLKRNEELVRSQAVAQADYDTAKAAYGVALANVEVDKAQIKAAEATLLSAKTDLGYTTIPAPVKGVVIDRRVNVGQTVVSTMSAASLFLLAKDLTRMQIWASVNEADIGRIHPGMHVSFTVDAHPNETFEGNVIQIRYNATMTQNVVTYTVVVAVDNSSRKLLPYLTANVQFQIERHPDVLMVPNAALRWKPRREQIAPDIRDTAMAEMSGKGGKGGRRSDKNAEEKDEKADEGEAASPGSKNALESDKKADAPLPDAKAVASVKADDPAAMGKYLKAHAEKKPAPAEKPAADADKDAAADKSSDKPQPMAGKKLSGKPVTGKPPKPRIERGRIWTKDGDYVRPLNVRIVATDGTMTEITGKDLKEDMEIVVGENVVVDSNDTTNPFAPKLFKGGKKM